MLRIVNYNIHSGRNLFFRHKLDEIAYTLRTLDADVIMLQEVHQNRQHGYQAEDLAHFLSYEYVFGPALPVIDGAYGNAILTRLPLLDTTNKLMPTKNEPRSLLQATLTWQERNLHVWTTHLSLGRKTRHGQFGYIAEQIEAASDLPLILTGDFNTEKPHLPHSLRDCAKEKGRETLPTFLPFAKRYDFVFASSAWHILDYEVVNVRWSDHFPIVVTLEWAGSVEA